MAWTPTKNVVDLTKIVDNLLNYIEDEQTDALTWANGGTSGLDDFASFYTNASGRLYTKFPSLMVLGQQDDGEEAETDEGDVLVTTLDLIMEVTLSGPNADDLVLTTKVYDLALKSMLANIPAATLTADSKVATHAVIIQLGTKFDVLNKLSAKVFIQVFQTEVIYKLITRAF